MAVFGLGLGVMMQPITLAVQNAMPPQDIGVATSSATFFRQMGGTAGTAVFLSVLFSTVGDKIKRRLPAAARRRAFQQALHDPACSPTRPTSRSSGCCSGGGEVGGSALNDTSFRPARRRRCWPGRSRSASPTRWTWSS